MTGEIIIKHVNGWACSNDAKMIIAHNVTDTITEQKSKERQLVQRNAYFEVNGLYEAKGKLTDKKVICIFKSGNYKFEFIGLIEENRKEAITIKILGELKEFKIKTIEQWLEV